MSAAHRIKLDIFEGPLDLLLHLIKTSEMEITDIEISAITSQYIEYINAMQELDLEVAGDYLVMAATLLNIKSRALLPRNPELESLTNEEEIDEIMSTQDLIRRLVEYRKFKEAAGALRVREEEQRRLFYRANIIPIAPSAEKDLPRQDIRSLFDAFAKVLARVKIDRHHEVLSEQYSVEEKVLDIQERLKANKQVNFTRVFSTCVHKQEIVCYFLAILELAKRREITLAQAGPFEDILVELWDDKVIYVG